MIEFDGPLSEKNQLDRGRKINKNNVLVLSIGSMIVLLFTIVFGLLFNFLKELKTDLIVFFVIMAIVCLLIFYTPKSIILRFKVKHHIVISKNEIKLESMFKKNGTWIKKPISKIKKIVDYGEIYYIYFKFGDVGMAWVCQKDNLKQGTLEEFEDLFQKKLKREYK